MTAAMRASDHDASHGMAHGPIPGSPTLTNPDMILPDYAVPDSPRDRLQSPLELWNDPNIGRMDFQLPPQNYGSQPIASNTPIIYGNGTMLSDIGEVTEVESTVGPTSRRTSSRYSMHTDDGETYGAAIINKANYRASKILARERSASVGSNSTITTLDFRAAAPEFDDSASVDDSNFQGDDEESMASSYVEGTVPQNGQRPGKNRTPHRQGDEPYSTTYISERAEHILANAKRRLTAMEGNLTRARSSLAYSPNSDGSTPSPRVGNHGVGVGDNASGMNAYHSRIRSEDGTRDITKPAPFVQRSASALGSAGGYRPTISASKRHEAGTRGGQLASQKLSQTLEQTLEPLSEDDRDIEDYSPGDSVRSSYLGPAFNANGIPDRPLSRSASAAQMRDIQDQMQGLKGKISSLREQARADSMKRRSLQSLRTPSPFTHARWDPGMMEAREFRSISTPRQSGDFGPPADVEPDVDTDHRQTPTQESQERPKLAAVHLVEEPTPRQDTPPLSDKHVGAAADVLSQRPQTPPQTLEEEDLQIENGDTDDLKSEDERFVDSRDDFPDLESESGDSTYHDSQQHQLSHEDREDAFDYEHFFLHSAMGSMSRQRSRRRGSLESSESEASEDSVETTRGPIRDSPRKRRSMDTNASEDSFETATEGRASRSSAFQNDQADGDLAFTNDGTYDEVPPVTHGLMEEAQNQGTENRRRQNSVLYRPTSANSGSRMHRPSISSFESTGTNRSFPLVNRTKVNGEMITPGGSPDPALVQVSESLLHQTSSLAERGENGETLPPPVAPIQSLHREDQIAVERLVASLGKCVLTLGEGSRAGTEARQYRRRIEAARRILEGSDE